MNVVLLKIMEVVNLQAQFEQERPTLFPVATHEVVELSAFSNENTKTISSEKAHKVPAIGGRLCSLLEAAKTGLLDHASDVVYGPPLDYKIEKERDVEFLKGVKKASQAEMECHVCYSLMLDPTTTPCGHTFCRKCLARILDHSRLCPECRRTLFLPSSLSSQPSNKYLVDLLDALCPDQVAARAEAAVGEERSSPDGLNTPLFPCTLAFPGLRTYLHIFEPRYRLMIRRTIEGNGQFGMLAYNRFFEPQGELGRVHFTEIGTMLQIERYQMLPDGRSYIECKGLHRFRVRSHGMMDGYIIANVEKIEDISLAEEEQKESEETSASPLADEDSSARIARQSTAELRDIVRDFVTRARQNSERWFSSRLLETYGEPPDDPATLPYWMAAVLPLVDEEKYQVLPLTSTRDRLKLVARWVHQIESQGW